VQKTISYIAHADECQIKAVSASTDELKVEYLILSRFWADLADERQKWLFDPKRSKPH